MRRRKRSIPVVLTNGVKQAADSKVQQLGALDVAENCYFEKTGRLVKRRGFDDTAFAPSPYSGGPEIGDGRREIPFRSSSVLATSRALYSTDSGVFRGYLSESNAPTRTVVARDITAGHSYACSIEANGHRVVAWVVYDHVILGHGTLWAALLNSENELVFKGEIDTDTATKPRLTKLGNVVVLMWVAGGTSAPHDLKFQTMDCSVANPSWGGATTVATDVTTERIYDCHANSTAFFFAWYDGTDIEIRRYNNALAQTHQARITTDASSALGIYASTDHLCVGWSNSSGPVTNGAIRSAADLTQVVATTAIHSGVESYSVNWAQLSSTDYLYVLGQMPLVGSFGAGQTFARTKTGTLNSAGTAAITPTDFWNLLPASRPHIHDSRVYCVEGFIDPLGTGQEAYYLCELFYDASAAAFPRPVSAIATSGTGYMLHNLQSAGGGAGPKLGQISEPEPGEFLIALPEKFRFEENLHGEAGATLYGWSFNDTTAPMGAELGSTLYLSGGYVSQFDGETVVESGFAWGPSRADVSFGAGSNNWQYVFTYVWMDAGQLHESAPSQPFDAASATFPVTLQVQSLNLTNKYRPFDTEATGTPVAIRYYRTIHNGTAYFFVGDIECEIGSPFTQFTDSATDNDIQDNVVLYTEGGLPNSQLVPASCLITHDNRIFAGLSNGVIFTKQWTSDRSAQFTPDLSHTLDTRDEENVTGLGVLDDALVIGKSSYLYGMQGNGPGPGGSPIYPTPRRIPTDVGFASPLGIVTTPQGLIWSSGRGPRLLPRGFGNVTWIGQEARDVFEDFPAVVGGVMLEDRNLVAFIAHDQTPGAGECAIVYLDYERGQWTYGLPATRGRVFLSACMVDGTLRLLESSGGASTIWIEGTDTYEDGEHLVFAIETTKVRPNQQIAGFQRCWAVRILGEVIEPCELVLKVGLNDAAPAEVARWDLGSSSAGDTFVLEHVLAVQKATSYRFRIEDATSEIAGDAPSNGFALNGIELDVVTLDGGYPLHASARR